MTKRIFRKILSANDAGETKSHQSGMLIPKGDREFLEFLGPLDSSTKNPRRTMRFRDPEGRRTSFEFIHYNNKLHDAAGTRNEFRLTRMTRYLRDIGAQSGDEIEISRRDGDDEFEIRIIKPSQSEQQLLGRVVLKGWRRVH